MMCRCLLVLLLVLMLLSSAAPVAAQSSYIYQNFDNPILLPAWLYGTTAQILQLYGAYLGTPSVSGNALLVTGDNNTIGQNQGIAVYHEFVLPQAVYVSTVTAWVYNSQANSSSFQLIEWDADTGAYIATWPAGGTGTGNRTLTLNRVVSRKFWIALHKSGFGGSSTIGIDNLQINVNQALSPASPTPTSSPTVTLTPLVPTNTPFVGGWLPTRAATLLPICVSTPTPGVSPTRALGGTVYSLSTRTPTSTPSGGGGEIIPLPDVVQPHTPEPTFTATRTPMPTLACIPRHEVVEITEFPPLLDIGIGGITSETCLTIVPPIDIPSAIVLPGLPLFGDVTITIPFFGGFQVDEHQLCVRLRDFKMAFLGVDVSWLLSTALAMLGLWFLLFFRREM